MAMTGVRDWFNSNAKKYGYKNEDLGWDDKNKTVTVKGQSFFKPTNMQNGASYGDSNQLQGLMQAMAVKSPLTGGLNGINNSGGIGVAQTISGIGPPPQMQVTQPQQNQTAYKSPYEAEIQKALSAIQNRQFSYDPSKDIGLQNAVTDSTNTIQRLNDRRNWGYSDSSRAQMNQEALKQQGLYRGQAYNEFNQGTNDLVTQLNALKNQDATDYGKYRDTMGDTRQNMLDAQAQTKNERTDFVNSIKGLGDQMDYQAQINTVRDDNDPTNDWKIPFLMQERQAKIENKSTQKNNELKAQLEYQITQLEAAVKAGQISKVDADLKLNQAKFDYQQKNDAVQNGISQQNADTSSINAQTSKTNSDTGTKGQLTYKDYYTSGKDMMTKGVWVTDPDTQEKTYQEKSNPQDVYNWIKGLPIDVTQKAKLAKDLGIPESVKKQPKLYNGQLIPSNPLG